MSLGEAYADMFNKVVVTEDAPAGQIGDAPLTKGGPEEEGGYREPLVDITKMSDKDKKDNIYNIKGYTYGDGNDPGDCQEPHPTGPTFGQASVTGNVGPEEDEENEEKKDKKKNKKKKGKYDDGDGKDEKCDYVPCEGEEDEEFLEEHEKIARDGLNNFMSKTSVFDKLYNKVMVNENFGEFEDAEDDMDIEALGIEMDDEGGDDGEVTITISKECCKEIHAACEKALGVSDDEPDEDFEAEVAYEEDEEGIDPGSTLNHTVNMGDGGKNKVGDLKPAGAATEKGVGQHGVDPGSTLNHTVDMGKNNKVGNLSTGKKVFEK